MVRAERLVTTVSTIVNLLAESSWTTNFGLWIPWLQAFRAHHGPRPDNSQIYLPAAEFDTPAPGERRGKMKPEFFVVLTVTRQ